MTNTVQAHYRAVTQSGGGIEARNGELPMAVHKLIVLAMTDTEAAEALLGQRAELLAAIKVMLRDYAAVHDIGDVEMQPAIYQARAAIAKAEGGTA